MALNPVLAQDQTSQGELFPLPSPGEVFILKRDGINFAATTPTKKFSGSGQIFLTNKRIVFLRSGKPASHKNFTSVELPLHLMKAQDAAHSQPQFKQPIFGANYLDGKTEPYMASNNPFSGTTKWTLTFNKGGCQTFLKVFYRLHKQAVANPDGDGVDPDFAHQVQLGPQAAFYDPTDTSVLYITQPVPQNSPYPPSPSAPPPSTSYQQPPTGYQQQQPPSYSSGSSSTPYQPSSYPPSNQYPPQQQQQQFGGGYPSPSAPAGYTVGGQPGYGGGQPGGYQPSGYQPQAGGYPPQSGSYSQPQGGGYQQQGYGGYSQASYSPLQYGNQPTASTPPQYPPFQPPAPR